MGRDAWQLARIRELGTPIGTAQFVAEAMEARFVEERRLWEAIPSVPDLQCAWQILVQNANPRANHTLRTLLPSECAGYAEAHDMGMWSSQVQRMPCASRRSGTPQSFVHMNAVARICREAGDRVRFNAFLRDMNINVGAADERRIEVLAQDLPSFGGAQLAVDVGLRSVLSATGEHSPPHCRSGRCRVAQGETGQREDIPGADRDRKVHVGRGRRRNRWSLE